MIKKYGTSIPLQNKLIKEKLKNTNLEKYGCINVFQNELIKEKLKNTNLEKYGCVNPFQSESIKEKSKNTNLEKYGTENPMQNSDIIEKSSLNSKKFKDYKLPNGEIIKIQGFENKVIDELLETHNINDIFTKRTDMPEIWYFDDNGKYHRYYPDIYIPKYNKIIEVKSIYTYKQNTRNYHKKKKACEYLEYVFEDYIFKSQKDNRVHIHL